MEKKEIGRYEMVRSTLQAAVVASPPHCSYSSRTFAPPLEHCRPFEKCFLKKGLRALSDLNVTLEEKVE